MLAALRRMGAELPNSPLNSTETTSALLTSVRGMGTTPNARPIGRFRTADELISALVDVGEIGGGTESPFAIGDTVEVPESGYCVALRGGDLAVPPVLLGDRANGVDASVEQAGVALLTRWYEDVSEHLRSGHCWVGYWRDDVAGEMEINVTVVVIDESLALSLARHQQQKAIWHLDTATEIEIGGDGGPGWNPDLPLAPLETILFNAIGRTQ